MVQCWKNKIKIAGSKGRIDSIFNPVAGNKGRINSIFNPVAGNKGRINSIFSPVAVNVELHTSRLDLNDHVRITQK